MLRRASYRARQFFGGFRAVTPAELAFVRGVLSRRELALFADLQARDQRHSLNVALALHEAGDASRDLLVAALLHDIGKGDLWVGERIAYVLLSALSPRLVDRLAAESPRWRDGLWRLRHHARLGAARLAEEQTSQRVVALVASHIDGDASEDAELERLQAADRSH